MYMNNGEGNACIGLENVKILMSSRCIKTHNKQKLYKWPKFGL